MKQAGNEVLKSYTAARRRRAEKLEEPQLTTWNLRTDGRSKNMDNVAEIRFVADVNTPTCTSGFLLTEQACTSLT